MGVGKESSRELGLVGDMPPRSWSGPTTKTDAM